MTDVPEPLNTLLVFNAVAGAILEGFLGLAAFAWCCEKIADFTYRKMRCAVVFLEFLRWKQRNKK